MKDYALINKNFYPSDEAKISVNHRAVRFGDGIFETCKIFNSKIYDFINHKKRFEKGIKKLELNFSTQNLHENLLELIEKNKIKEGFLRFSLSRGEGSMGYLAKNNIQNLFIAQTLKARKPSDDKKIKINISKIKLMQRPKQLQGLKLNNSIDYILTKIQAKKNGFLDSLMLNHKNEIAECSSANVFFVKNNKIYTPKSNSGMVLGTVRDKIIKISNRKINFINPKISFLNNIDEIFISNSNLLALPIDELKLKDKTIKLKSKIGTEIQNLLIKDLNKLKKDE